MHIFIVYAHPSTESFTYSVCNAFIQGIIESGHSYEISDLYRMNFNPDMSLAEYCRESTVNEQLPVPEDVLTEQEKMERADVIAFIYPLWWSDCPAKLKGWFDRVYTVGYAYLGDHSATKIKIKKAVVICTAGHTEEHLAEAGIMESIRRVMVYDRLYNVGVKEARLMIIGGNIQQDEKTMDEKLERVYGLGKGL